MTKAVIIGASSGIGKELAFQLSAKGCILGLMARRIELLQDIQSELATLCFIQAMDVSKTETVEQELNHLIKQMGGLDLIVISAGTGHRNRALDIELEIDTINVNIAGFTTIAIGAFKYFEKQKSGHIVGISSIAALKGNAVAPSYNASKAYVSNYMEGLRLKAFKENLDITVTDIRPGYIDTKMAEGDGIFWMSSPVKAVRQIIHAVEKKKSCAYITKRWLIIAVLIKIMPKYFYRKLKVI